MHQQLAAPPTCPNDVTPDVAAAFALFQSAMKYPTAADGPTLLMLANSWVTWRKATDQVNAVGTVVMSGGTAIANPNLGVAHQAHGQILALCKELGLTAAARRKMHLDDSDDDE